MLAMDGHSIMRIGLKAVFEREGCEVIGPYATGEEVLSQVEGAKPDLVLLGLNPSGATDGVEVCKRIKRLPDPPRVLVHTAYNFAEDVSSCFLAGADSYLHKSTNLDDILEAAKRTASGDRVWLPGERVGEQRGRLSMTPTSARLTDREREILSFMLRRYSNPEIAQKLCISVQTTKNHASNVLRKLGVASRKDLFSGVEEASA